MGRTVYYEKPKRLEKLSKEKQLDINFDLINAIRLAKTPYEAASLLQNLFTASEIKKSAKRLRIAKLLLEGGKQREVAKELKCSLATVTKVSAWIQQGKYEIEKIINKLPVRYAKPKKLPKIPMEFQLPQVLLTFAQHSLEKRQTANIEKFVDEVEEKKYLDKQLQEYFNDQYRKNK